MSNKILFVVAHPDDEVLGCGGSIAKHVRGGGETRIIFLGEGMTSRFPTREEGLASGELKRLKASVKKATERLGVSKTYHFDFPDNRFDTVALLDIVKVIEGVKKEFAPDVVCTHSRGDLNVDHRATFNAVITGCRPFADETVREIYSFEIPSSTNWSYPAVFNPTVFIDIGDFIDIKVEALKMYQTELKQSPHPDSPENIVTIARWRGSMAGLRYAEAFEAIRIIK